MSFFRRLLSVSLFNENPKYVVAQTYQNMNIRSYESYIVAETIVEADLENAGNKAFGILAGYIFGKNNQGTKIAMTAPVIQQELAPNKYLIQFMMPSEWKLQTLPKPTDSRVKLRKLPSRKVAAITYNGGWRESLYLNNLNLLQADIRKIGLIQTGKPIWARYNSPMAPEFMRKNEILLEIE